MKGQQLFLTGGTGFFGHWLLESFLHVNERLALRAEVTILTRDPEKFLRKSPYLAGHSAVRLWTGNVQNFAFPSGPFHALVHAATEANPALEANQPEGLRTHIVEGTRQVLDFAREQGVKKFLFTSSGAVYGTQPPDLSHLAEDRAETSSFPPATTAYGLGKQESEKLCAEAARASEMNITVARCFAFVGPHLPLDAHFAIGNFIRDAVEGRFPRINGDGSPFRSYLYTSDLAVWLWTILFRGVSGRAYNVGSDEALTIRELAEKVSAGLNLPVTDTLQCPTKTNGGSRYVPSIQRARTELDLKVEVSLVEAIRKTADWTHLQKSSPVSGLLP
jgi:dTDP-glucose 4,6-dehydratase